MHVRQPGANVRSSLATNLKRRLTMNLFFREYGNGTPVLIFHGLLGSSGNWHTLSRGVLSERYHVYAVDLRNHGRSPHSDQFNYSVMVRDVLRLMDEEGIRSAHIIGHSMGAKVAMHFAAKHPDRVRKLILVDLGPGEYGDRHSHILNALSALDPSEYADRDEIDAVLAESIPNKGERAFLMKNLTRDGRTKKLKWQMNLPVIKANYPALNEALPESAVFDGRTLIIRGDKSDYITDDQRPLIKHHFPKSNIVTLKNAGHWVHADQPHAFGKTVKSFLDAR